ncbi:MAG: hypothetical protein ACO3JL_17320 [Myxococcota bacterium]
MSREQLLRGGWIASALGLTSVLAYGTTLVDTRFHELRMRADVVAHVRVERASASWTGTRNSRIVTLHEVAVVQLHQGDLAPMEQEHRRIVVGVPGGTVGDIAQWVPESPSLHVGAEYLLLLGPPVGPGGARGVVGLRYGMVPVSSLSSEPPPPLDGGQGAAAR